MPSATGIIPRFDLQQARWLLQKGRTPLEVIAAAERLGDDQLKEQIVMYVFSVRLPLYWAHRRKVMAHRANERVRIFIGILGERAEQKKSQAAKRARITTDVEMYGPIALGRV